MNKQQNRLNWNDEDAYWRSNYRSRPYASGNEYDYFQPGYRYGFDAANRYGDREWRDVEAELSSGWNSYEYRGKSTWQQVKDAAHDAWDRVTGHHHAHTH